MLYADQRWIGDHGIGRFARNVLAELNYSPIPLSSNPASPLDPLRLARALGGLGLTRSDLFFSPGYSAPLFSQAPFVLTIHDLNHIDRPENSSIAKRIYYATLLKRACQQALHILTVSEFSRSRIVEWSGLPPEKVVNVGCGVDSAYHPGVVPYDPPFPYLLCVSNRKAHKNEFRTVEAFATSGVPQAFRLVFTGYSTPALAECIRRHGLTDRVCFLGSVPESKMPSLYRGASALILASLYEGFGLPVLEAMACGTPVVTSNVTALPEIAGNASLLVDPLNVSQIADSIRRILTDKSLREQLRSRGLARAEHFSWATTTRMVREVLGVQDTRRAGENQRALA